MNNLVCHLCGGFDIVEKTDHYHVRSKYDGELGLVSMEYLECQSCFREFIDKERIIRNDEKIRLFEDSRNKLIKRN